MNLQTRREQSTPGRGHIIVAVAVSELCKWWQKFGPAIYSPTTSLPSFIVGHRYDIVLFIISHPCFRRHRRRRLRVFLMGATERRLFANINKRK